MVEHSPQILITGSLPSSLHLQNLHCAIHKLGSSLPPKASSNPQNLRCTFFQYRVFRHVDEVYRFTALIPPRPLQVAESAMRYSQTWGLMYGEHSPLVFSQSLPQCT